MKLPFHFKVLIVSGVLLILLLALVIKAIMIRQRKIMWLQNLNRQAASVEGENMADLLKTGVSSIPTVSMEERFIAGLPTPTPLGGMGGQWEDDIEREQARLADILDTFSDYDAGKRAQAEAALFVQFERLIRKCSEAEKAGHTSDVLRRVEAVFQQIDALGHPYSFQDTDARRQFAARLSAGWAALPYVGRWGYIRMMGAVGGAECREALRNAMTEGVFEDEAAISLLRSGDPRSMPVIMDYLSRGRIKGGRYDELKRVLVSMNDPRVIDALIASLDSTDGNMRASALSLLELLTAGSEEVPAGSNAADTDLKRKWGSWWVGHRSSYKPPPMEHEQEIIALSLITGLDSLPAIGRFTKGYFKNLSSRLEETCSRLRSLDLKEHAKGERMFYSIVKEMAENYHMAGKSAVEVFDQYIRVFSENVQKICVKQVFPQSPERSDFTRWASANIEKARLPVIAFVLRMVGISSDPEAAGFLKKYAQSWAQEARRAAVMSLARLGQPEATTELERILAEKDLPVYDSLWCIAALDRIGDRKAKGILVNILREGQPLISYDAYLVLKRIRGQEGKPLSLEEFEQGRTVIADEYAAWYKTVRE